jgi:predicted dithiol-disulfide oxidoreductase (DUF899 family)
MEKVAARRVRVAGFTAVRRAPTVRIEAFKRRMKRLSVWGGRFRRRLNNDFHMLRNPTRESTKYGDRAFGCGCGGGAVRSCRA